MTTGMGITGALFPLPGQEWGQDEGIETPVTMLADARMVIATQWEVVRDRVAPGPLRDCLMALLIEQDGILYRALELFEPGAWDNRGCRLAEQSRDPQPVNRTTAA